MSHQTGIHAGETLKKFYAKCKEGKIRVLKISIENEELVHSDSKNVNGTWEKDYDALILPLIEENQPCYILYRLDTTNESGFDWLLINWCPDTSPIRQKMLYASTKATLKLEFGTSQIKEEIHGTILSDINFKGYVRHKRSSKEPAPLTTREEELQEMRRNETPHEISLIMKQKNLDGISFKVDDAASKAVRDIAKGTYNYAQFKIDLDTEEIHLVLVENVKIDGLPSKVPSDSARYHLYNFKHTHEGDYTETKVFIYSTPGFNCPVRERMLYSCSKMAFILAINKLGVEVERKLEIDSGDELTEKYLYEEVHPTKSLHQPKFSKPKGPPNRGPKRMTKSTNTN